MFRKSQSWQQAFKFKNVGRYRYITPIQGCQPPPPPHIFDREGMIDGITHGTWRHLCKNYSLPLIVTNLRWHKTRNKDVGIIAFDLISLLSTNHIFILQWHSRVNEEMFDVNIKIAQTTQYSWDFIVGNSSLLNKWLTLVIILEISYSDLETTKYGPNLESPRLSGRDDRTAHVTKNIFPIACTVINKISSLERFPHNSIDLLCIQQFMSYCFTQIHPYAE